ncbi:MAG: histidinol-phosphate transaminase [Planctomycetota bacterium]|nr:histidinol-phosphate transaminase [Planctomycetota bacterium]
MESTGFESAGQRQIGDKINSSRVILREATEQDRQEIYKARHDVYAVELGQHPMHPERLLKTHLDEFNRYIVAIVDGQLAGFISLTPPGGSEYSLDSYIPREQWPFDATDTLFEVRLLTVVEKNRGSLLSSALMYAAFRAVEASGGERMMVIGRKEIVSIYKKSGFQDHGIELIRGKVTFHLMSTTVDRARAVADSKPGLISRIEKTIDWQLTESLRKPAACFHGGGFFQDVGEDFRSLSSHQEIVNADVLDAWFSPAPGVLESLSEHLDWLVRTSPPTGCEGLIESIATARGVPSSRILPGSGSSDLIFLAFGQWLTAESRVLLLDPTYGEYFHVCEQIIRCRVERFPLRRADGFQLDPVALEERLSSGDFDLVVIVNPNSPTGRHLPRQRLEQLIERVPKNTRFWIDETYVEYVGHEQSLEAYACLKDNVVVCKSMSKVYALSGVRSAYLCASAALLEPLRALTPPWAVSLPGQVAAVKALEDPAYYQQKYRATGAAREQLSLDLQQLGLEVIPGVANFLLTFLPENGPDAAQVVSSCRQRGVHLRDASNMGTHLGPHALRTAVKSTEQNQRIVSAIENALQPVSA